MIIQTLKLRNLLIDCRKLLQSGSSSKLVNECKKELKKKDIEFSKRLTILIYLNNILWKEDKELFEENRRIIRIELNH